MAAAHPKFGVQVVVHAFLDGRDVQPGTAPGYLRSLEEHLAGKGVIGTVSGMAGRPGPQEFAPLAMKSDEFLAY